MNYPVWNVPYLGSGMVIAIIAIIHVMISHFAIGGGFFLALTEAKALREGREDWLNRLKGYSKFFLILTGVFGAMTGVGIWFAIGLASPSGTSTLIHNFVFGWAIEWVVFLLELSIAAVYYYTWGRVPKKTHLKIGIAYAISSFFTLALINGILTFKLTPGQTWLSVAGTGQEPQYFFQAFFNPTFWPSLFLRTLVCISMAGVVSLVFFSRMDGDKEPKIKRDMVRWSSVWLLPAFVLMPVFFVWYLWMVPDSQRDLMTLGMSTIGMGAFTQVTRLTLMSVLTTATIVGVVYFLAYMTPREFKFGHALAIVVLAFLATASTEGVREMLRKPYIVMDYMFSNGTLKSQVDKLNEVGYLTNSPWKPSADSALAVANSSLEMEVGRRMFAGQCMSCHTVDGYRAMSKFLQGRDEKSIGNILEMMHQPSETSPYVKFMPPVVGTQQEVAALRTFLNSIVNPAEPPAQSVAAQ